VDRDKVIKQAVPISDVYRTIQAFVGIVHQLFQSLRPPVAGLHRGRGDYRTKAENVGQFYVRESKWRMVRSPP
jgi:HAE1 family hydrophobic/amphiphilic exporter-1